jgi:hypothetical protein
MAWFTDTTNAPLIVLRKSFYDEYVFITIGSSTFQVKRAVKSTEQEWTGLTMAAADSIAAAKNALANTDATSERMNDAGAYKVMIKQDSYGAWA